MLYHKHHMHAASHLKHKILLVSCIEHYFATLRLKTVYAGNSPKGFEIIDNHILEKVTT